VGKGSIQVRRVGQQRKLKRKGVGKGGRIRNRRRETESREKRQRKRTKSSEQKPPRRKRVWSVIEGLKAHTVRGEKKKSREGGRGFDVKEEGQITFWGIAGEGNINVQSSSSLR